MEQIALSSEQENVESPFFVDHSRRERDRELDNTGSPAISKKATPHAINLFRPHAEIE